MIGVESNLRKEIGKYIRKKAALQAKIHKETANLLVMNKKIEDLNLKLINMQKKNVVLMAIAGGRATSEGEGFKKTLLTGITPVKVLCVNPDKKELEAIYGRELDKAPEYLSADENGVKKIRFDFIVQTVPNDKLGVNVEVVDKISYFLEDKPNVSQGGKFQVINLYGETTWATKDEIQSGKLPDNMSFYDTTKMRPAFKGEEELVNFLKQFLGIPNKGFNGKFIANISDAEIQLDDVKKYFGGNYKEIVSAIDALKDTNVVKVLAGVKTTDDNKQYQSWFTQKPVKYSVNDYQYVSKLLKEKKDNGAYAAVDFGPADFKFRLYNNEPTVFTASPNRSMPFDDPFDTAINTGVKANATVDDSWFNS